MAKRKKQRGPRRRRRIRERDGDACYYCGEPMLFEPPFEMPKHKWAEHPQQATIEHILDRSDGGSNDLFNLALAHKCCNNNRSQMRFADKIASRSPKLTHQSCVGEG